MKRLFCGLVTLGLFFGAAGHARSDSMYWSDFFGGGDIQQANLDGSGQTSIIKGLGQPAGITLDLAGSQMYFADYARGEILRANLDGSGQTILASRLGSLPWVALDLAHGYIYCTNFTGRGRIQRANLDGTGLTTLVDQNLNYPCCIALDVAGGKMYWTDSAEFSGGIGDIQRANLDGSGQEILISGLPNPHGMTLDLANGKMYWTDTADDIRRANLDGSGQEILIQGAGGPSSIALNVTGGQMYWTTWGTGEIRRANLDGSGQQILMTGLSGPVGIVLDLSAPPPSRFQITATPTAVAGTPFDITVTALDASGNIGTTYQGTVTFSSSDTYPGLLPTDYPFTSADQGTHTFSGGVTFFTAGAQTLTAQDTADSSLTGSATVSVVAAPASQLLISAPANAVSGTPFDVMLTALDPYVNVDLNYAGTVTWTSSDADPGLLLPPDYPFQPTDNGMVTFAAGVILITLGNQTLTATDTVSGITGSATVTVGP
jgi:sugar lactone lactonase YvrE